jgi:small subunit ribosomal protein S7
MTTLLGQNERDDAKVIEQNLVPAALAAFNPEISSLTNDNYVGDTFADTEGLGVNAPPPLHPSTADARDPNAKPLIPPRNDPLLEYIANHIMRSGHKHRAQRIVANTLAEIHRLTGASPLPILRSAIFRASPSVRVASMKKGAKTRLVPVPLADKQRTFYAVKWLLKQSDNRGEQKLEQRLAKEVIAIIEGSSRVLNQKAEVHKVALANRYVNPLYEL